jgi:hypothetical protein
VKPRFVSTTTATDLARARPQPPEVPLFDDPMKAYWLGFTMGLILKNPLDAHCVPDDELPHVRRVLWDSGYDWRESKTETAGPNHTWLTVKRCAPRLEIVRAVAGESHG